MTPVATPFFFYFLAALSVGSALGVILRKNAVHSAIFLIFTLLAQAGLYLMLYAPFVAGVQIILYAGGIMVLVLFVIMLVNLERSLKEEQFNKQWIVGTVVAVSFGALLLIVYRSGAAGLPSALAALPEASNTQDVGVMLYRNYMLPFEIASLLLLVAIVGAVVMAKKRI
jgi:NADH-quinone oxidoreductase subunit J